MQKMRLLDNIIRFPANRQILDELIRQKTNMAAHAHATPTFSISAAWALKCKRSDASLLRYLRKKCIFEKNRFDDGFGVRPDASPTPKSRWQNGSRVSGILNSFRCPQLHTLYSIFFVQLNCLFEIPSAQGTEKQGSTIPIWASLLEAHAVLLDNSIASGKLSFFAMALVCEGIDRGVIEPSLSNN